MDRQTQLKLWSSLFAVVLTLAAGWAGLRHTSIVLFYMGIIGAIPMILIEGVHGGGTHNENVVGGVVFVVVNILFYYFVFNWMLAKIFKMDRGNRGSS
jgi:hypothetical protein